MPRPKLISRPRKLTLHLPEDRVVRLELYLTSATLGRIPQGALGAFFTERIDEFFLKMGSKIPPLPKEKKEELVAAVNEAHFGPDPSLP